MKEKSTDSVKGRAQTPLKVIISGGGTGGHIFPAISIANALRRRLPDCRILFVGAESRMEMERVPAAGYDIVGLPVSGLDRKHLLRNVKVLWRLWKSIRMARKVIRDFAPDVAVGVGGYASGPTLKAAQKRGVPTLLQEQNSYAGVTNKLLARKAGYICTAYPDMDRFFPKEKIEMTGNPVRSSLLENTMTPAEAKRALGFAEDKPLLLVVGGSLGAKTINRAVADGLDKIEKAGVSMLWQTGKAFASDSSIKNTECLKDIKATTFISEMDIAYRGADLVVSRAGAGSISELQLLGKPVILVPSPNVAEDHQRKNALALSERGAALMITDMEAPVKLVDSALELIADHSKLETLSDNIFRMALPDADDKIADHIIRLAGR